MGLNNVSSKCQTLEIEMEFVTAMRRASVSFMQDSSIPLNNSDQKANLIRIYLESWHNGLKRNSVKYTRAERCPQLGWR